MNEPVIPIIRKYEGHKRYVRYNVIYIYTTDDEKVNSCCFSPDGSKIVSASYDKTLIIWNTSTGQSIKILEGHTSQVSLNSPI